MDNSLTKKKVLIAPLDWGLGHASRCIPIINYLRQKGCEIILASSGEQLKLLKKEFPDIKAIPLKGYGIRYSAHKRFFGAKILWQTPKILLRIRREHAYLQKVIDNYEIDTVISDNRYGLYSKKIPCIFITHQLKIKAPYRWMEKIIQKINYRFIEKFTACWVPDFIGEKNIAGQLSHPEKFPKTHLKYIGPLSRFRRESSQELLYKYFFVLSGPEPQRSILERRILNIQNRLEGKILIVRGKPGDENAQKTYDNFTMYDHLDTIQMQQAFLQSQFIISRSGYTTVMELLSLQKKSILIPTPGQTEQEYLAHHLMQQHWCYCCNQNDDLLYHIQNAEKFNYKIPALDEPFYKKVIDDFFDTSYGIS